MKLAIVGSRNFNDYDKFLDGIFLLIAGSSGMWDKIISGGAKGADLLAKRYADYYGVDYVEFPADWDKFGKSAGFRRNQQIVDACDMVLAFWDGKSRGTADTIVKARIAKKPTFIVYF